MRSLLILILLHSVAVVYSRHHVRVDACTSECGNINACCRRHGYDSDSYCHQGYAVCTSFNSKKDTRYDSRRRTECDGRCTTMVECCEDDLGYDNGGHCENHQAFCYVNRRKAQGGRSNGGTYEFKIEFG